MDCWEPIRELLCSSEFALGFIHLFICLQICPEGFQFVRQMN
uniref:Uncharacterized protein n=1 Tax=Anguilla anguilla TaxID=7936 RepID=A0A0E9UMG6_ANGAN